MHSGINNTLKRISSLLGFIPSYHPYPFDNLTCKDHFNFTQLSSRNYTRDLLEKVIVEIRALLKNYPSEVGIWSFLGQLYRVTNQISHAKSCFFFQISCDCGDLNPWLDLAYCYRDEGNVIRYELIFSNYREITPFFAESKISSLDERVWDNFFNSFLTFISQRNFRITKSEIIDQKKKELPFLLNLDSNLISVSHYSEKGTWTPGFPSVKKGKSILCINPPKEEPLFHLQKYSKDMINEFTSRTYFLYNDCVYVGKGQGYGVPLGLLRVANTHLEKGDTIMFLDCVASLPTSFPNSQDRITPSGNPINYGSTDYSFQKFRRGLLPDEIRECLKKIAMPDEIFITCTFTYFSEQAHEVIDICKEIFPSVPVTLGGIYPSLAQEHAQKSNADTVFVGSYQEAKNQALDYRVLGYFPGYILIKGTKGCPFSCAYCAVHTLEGNTFCHRAADMVFEEIYSAVTEYHAQKLVMWDSNLLMKYDEYFGRLLKKIIHANLSLLIMAPEGLDYRLMTMQIAKDLYASGFYLVYLALENIDSDYATLTLERKNSISLFDNAISLLKNAGFSSDYINAFVMTGLPNQELSSIARSLAYVWHQDITVTIFPFTPIPGTKLYSVLKESLKKYSLAELHPLYHVCVPKNQMQEYFEIFLFNLHDSTNQKDSWEELIHSDKFRSLLRTEIINLRK